MIYIKDMDMPVDCLACRISCKHESYLVTGRPKDCPLEEAKDGDLISRADAIEAICNKCGGCDDNHDECWEITALKALPSAEGGDAEMNEVKSPYMQHSPDGADLISRTDAIEAVGKEYEDAINIGDSGDAIAYDVERILSALPSAETTGALDDAIAKYVADGLMELPSAEAVQGWIPVEEQPPAFPCLVCDANGNQPSVPLGIVTITDEEHGEWHIDGRLWDTKVFVHGEWCSQTGYGNRIIAWMPLPKPYKGGEE